jgi:hypothetical protein
LQQTDVDCVYVLKGGHRLRGQQIRENTAYRIAVNLGITAISLDRCMIGVDKLVHKRARTLDVARAHGRDFVNNIVNTSSVRISVVFFVGRGTGLPHEKPLRLSGIEKNIL